MFPRISVITFCFFHFKRDKSTLKVQKVRKVGIKRRKSGVESNYAQIASRAHLEQVQAKKRKKAKKSNRKVESTFKSEKHFRK